MGRPGLAHDRGRGAGAVSCLRRTHSRAVQSSHTAADTLAMWKSSVKIAGTRITGPRAGTRAVSCVHAFALARTAAGDSLKRKLLMGPLMTPFSMRKTPSRVSPVMVIDCGSNQRVYQNRVT